MNLSYLARTVKLPPHPYCKAGYLVYKDKGIVIMKTAPRKRFYCVAYKVSVNALLIPYIPAHPTRIWKYIAMIRAIFQTWTMRNSLKRTNVL